MNSDDADMIVARMILLFITGLVVGVFLGGAALALLSLAGVD